MEPRIVLLLSAGIGAMGFSRTFQDEYLGEVQVGFLLGEIDDPNPLCEVFELRSPPPVIEPDARIFVRESPLPHYRQLEHKPSGRRSQLRRLK